MKFCGFSDASSSEKAVFESQGEHFRGFFGTV